MSIGEELARLADLHQKGRLSEAEFAKAKQAVLSQTGAFPQASVPEPRTPKKTIRLGLDFPKVTLIVAVVLAMVSFLAFVAPNWREADELERTLKKEQEEINRLSNKPVDDSPDGKGLNGPVKK